MQINDFFQKASRKIIELLAKPVVSPSPLNGALLQVEPLEIGEDLVEFVLEHSRLVLGHLKRVGLEKLVAKCVQVVNKSLKMNPSV